MITSFKKNMNDALYTLYLLLAIYAGKKSSTDQRKLLRFEIQFVFLSGSGIVKASVTSTVYLALSFSFF